MTSGDEPIPRSLCLIDGTYELFRQFFGAPTHTDRQGRERGAVRSLVRSLLGLLGEPGVEWLAVAFDHPLPGRAGAPPQPGGVPAELQAQYLPAELAVEALGITVWPAVRFSADTTLASAAARFRTHPAVDQVRLASADLDFWQCIRQDVVVVLDRRRRRIIDEAAVVDRFGLAPHQLPDYFALVGDRSDGVPGLSGWGKKSTSQVLQRFGSLERIPHDPGEWPDSVRSRARLARTLSEQRREVLIWREALTLFEGAPIHEELDGLRWRGVDEERFEALVSELDVPELWERIPG